MNKVDRLNAGLNRDQLGIEIAPWDSPKCPKRDGWNCLTIDILSRDELVQRGKSEVGLDQAELDAIETVDFVGSATEIESLLSGHENLGRFDYIISSHNFEHLVDPLKFLQGSATVLRDGGSLVMAIPDCRLCFDYYRQPTMLPEWLHHHHAKSQQPTPTQWFAQGAYSSTHNGVGAWHSRADPNNIEPNQDLEKTFDIWKALLASDSVPLDVHCSVFTPSSFELLIHEASFLGLIDFEIESVSAPYGCEFHVRLIKTNNAKRNREQFYQKRKHLLTAIKAELAPSPRSWKKTRRMAIRKCRKGWDAVRDTVRRLKQRPSDTNTEH